MADQEQQEIGEEGSLTQEQLVAGDIKKPGIKTKIFAVAVVAFVTFLTISIANFFIKQEEAKLVEGLKQRVEVLVLERADIVSTWLNGIVKQSRPLVQSDIFRLFAAEIDLADGDVSSVLDPTSDEAVQESVGEQPSYRDQVPFMINALTDMVRDTDYKAAYVIDRKGNTYLASVDATPLLQHQKDAALQVFDSAQVSFGRFENRGSGLQLDVYVPVTPVQFMEEVEQVVGAFIFTVDVGNQLNVLLQPNPISGLVGRYHLFQRSLKGGVDDVRSLANGGILETNLPTNIFEDNALSFADRLSFDGTESTYSYGAKIPNTSTMLLAWETPVSVARAGLDKLVINTYLIGLFFILLIVTAFGAFWWRSNSDHNKSLAKQYARFAGKIERQKQLLDTINNTIKEHIGLKNSKGNYTYVNPAFADSVGKSIEDVLGMDDEAVFGHGTAERFKKLDDLASNTGKPISTIDEVYLQGSKRHLQISKVPVMMNDEDGIVTVTRDVTDIIVEQEKREKSVKQTVSALVKAVELRDRHLGGHSRRLSEFSTAVAREVSTDIRVQRAVEIAANLSQIGKLDIPQDILTADRRLNEDEIEIMQKHIVNAENIVSEIDFDMPVVQSLGQMYERLDGSGYPRQLKDDEICLEARILGICDYFCARIEPRSYRQAITSDEALKFLEQNAEKYDPKIVEALRTVAHSSFGEKIIASIGAK